MTERWGYRGAGGRERSRAPRGEAERAAAGAPRAAPGTPQVVSHDCELLAGEASVVLGFVLSG